MPGTRIQAPKPVRTNILYARTHGEGGIIWHWRAEDVPLCNRCEQCTARIAWKDGELPDRPLGHWEPKPGEAVCSHVVPIDEVLGLCFD